MNCWFHVGKKGSVRMNIEEFMGKYKYSNSFSYIPTDEMNYYMDLLNQDGSYIYCLCCHNKIVYVGQTRTLEKRLKTHRRHLQFDSFLIGEVDNNGIQEILNDCEQDVINFANPLLNSGLTTFEKCNYGGNKSLKDIIKWLCENSSYSYWKELYQ